jgi:hypothetical protein
MPQTLGSLPIGAKVKFGSFRNSPVKWVIKDKNHSGFPSGAVTILTERIIKMMPFDGKESGNSDNNRKSYGNNRYIYSNIRKWLNSAAGPGGWYAAAHSADAPPSAANVWVNNSVAINPYDTIAGFMNQFSQDDRNAILDTTLTVGKATVDGGGTETCVDKIFLLSTAEVGLSGDFTEGSLLAGFSDNASRIATVDAACVADSNYQSNPAVDAAWYYWLRSPYASNSDDVRRVYSDGTLSGNGAYYGYYGLRPALNLASSILVSDSVDGDGYFTVIHNLSPLAPSYIDTPHNVYGTVQADISWGSASDPDGYIVGYSLERKYDNGSWAEIYNGPGQNYGDLISMDFNTVQYRVRAIDNKDAFSPYVTGDVRNISHTPPPIISITDGELGAFSDTPPTIQFLITDTNSEAVHIYARLDDVTIADQAGDLENENTFTIPAEVWIKTLNGQHILTLDFVDDYYNVVRRTFSFTKIVNEIKFMLSVPLDADERPSVIVASVLGSMPNGSRLTVEVCNNAFDDEPEWEDMTVQVKTKQKYFFQNQEKEAEKWGVNIRVTLNRGTAEEPVYITSVGGNFA